MRAARLAALALAAASSALAQAPAFRDIAGYELYQLLRFNAPDYAMTLGRDDFGVTFYGREFNRIEEVKCERKAAFGLVALANNAGDILVAVCEREVKRIRQLAPDAKRGLDTVIRELTQSGAKVDTAALEKTGWSYRHLSAADGEEYAFPVLLVGHGVVGPQTLVFLPKGRARAVVVQGNVQRLCEGYRLEAHPICTDTRGTFAQLARRVAARLTN